MSRLEIPVNDPRPSLNYPLTPTRLNRILVSVARWVFKGVMVMDIHGLENLPGQGAAIVASNHVNNFDVFPLQLALPRPLFFMGKAELFQIGFVHAVFRRMGGFPVYRGEGDAWALEHSTRLLAAGQLLAMFPEGTRSRGRGLAVAKTGAARLAIDTSVPIVTVSIDGSQRFFKQFPRRNRVQVVIAPPIIPQPGETAISLTDRMMYSMAASLPPELRGVYADNPPFRL
ncbi:MAG: lysophospholipid acyltransferase family protein [Anaerolineales bacterium]